MTTTDTRYQQTRWSLSDLFPAPNSRELETAFQTLDQWVAEFETFRDRLREDIPVEEFLKILHQLEKIQNLGARLYAYAGLLFSEDTQNQTAQTLTARVEQFVADLTNRTLFFNLWWKDLSDEAAARLMAAAGDLEYWLEALRHFKPHTLSEAEEKIINIKNVTGVNAL
ncbi:MAG: oligoendopeptidase F, partial [Bellilinea sp.]